MRKLACGLGLTFAVVGSGTSAQAGPWCAFYDSSTYNCGFHSYEQCYATIYGNGGWCRQNFFEPSARDRRSGKTRPLPARGLAARECCRPFGHSTSRTTALWEPALTATGVATP